MKKILLPTDFSTNSLSAINYAIDMFNNEKCEFYILHVLKTSTFISDDLMTMAPAETLYGTLIAESKKNIKKIIDELKRKNTSHRFTAIVDYDNFIDSINQICVTKKIDLIIMGTKGATGLEKVLFGSNTIRVIQRCSTPVLAIPKDYNFNGLESIVFTSNYLTLYNLNELLPLLDISKFFNSKIKILHIADKINLSENQINNKALLDSFFSNTEHQFVDLNSKNIIDTISEYIITNNIKLLAMMSKKHSFFDRLFVSHKVETFALKLNIPLLVMENSGNL